MSPPLARERETAIEAAHAAGALQLHQRSSLQIALKEDRSPVTQVDRACEELLVERLSASFPRDGFLGEEGGERPGTSGRTWVIDPLDGTRPYIRAIPTYSVLLALLDTAGRPELGVIHLPALGHTCWGVRGQGAFLDGERIHVSDTPELNRAMGSALGFIEKHETPAGVSLMNLMRSWDYAYGFMDAFTYVNVARGSLDLAVCLVDQPWDCAAAACIVEEAGGRFSCTGGTASVFAGTTLVTNGRLHEQALAFLNP